MFKLRSIRLSFLKFLLASNDVFHQSLATAVHVKAQLKCPLSSSIKMTTLISHSLY